MLMPFSRGPSMQLALSNQLDAEFAALVANPAKPLASLSVLAVREGGVVYKRQFGYKFIDNEKPGNSKRGDVDTLYRVASISKMITTLGVMKLIEEGKLSLTRRAGDFIPTFAATTVATARKDDGLVTAPARQWKERKSWWNTPRRALVALPPPMLTAATRSPALRSGRATRSPRGASGSSRRFVTASSSCWASALAST